MWTTAERFIHRAFASRRCFLGFASLSFWDDNPQEGAAMDRISAAQAHVDGASGLPTVLDAAYQGFEAILDVIRSRQEDAGDDFAAFVLSASAAADARDWIAAAPSLPLFSDPVRGLPLPLPQGQSIELTALALATLAGSLAERLSRAAKNAGSPADREACLRATEQAKQIRTLLGGASEP